MTSQISKFAFIGENVEIGSGVSIGPGAVVLGPCTIADDVWIGPGAQIGAPPEMTSSPQNSAWRGEIQHAGVHINTGAVIRELAVIHQGTYRPTQVGERSWVLNRAYLAHDVILGSDSTVSAGVSIGGHCEIGRFVNIGMNATVHQRVYVSGGCMIGMGTPLARDLPPFAKAFGSPARIRGLNSVGMQRLGISNQDVDRLIAVYGRNDITLMEYESNGDGLLQEFIEEWRGRENRRPASVEGFELG